MYVTNGEGEYEATVTSAPRKTNALRADDKATSIRDIDIDAERGV